MRNIPTTANNMRYLFLGQFISQVGENIARVALLYYLYKETHSVAAVALTGVLQNLPPLLFSPITGAVLDYHDKRQVLLVLDILRTLLSLAAPLLYLLHVLTIPYIEIIVLLTTICSGAFGPGLYSLIPSLLEEETSEDILKANSTIQTTGNAGVLIGPLLGGTLLTQIAAPLVMGISSFTFLLSSFFLWKIRRSPKTELRRSTQKAFSIKDFLGARGAKEILRSRVLVKSFMIYAVFGLLSIPLTLLLPELVSDKLNSGGMAFGALITSFGLGQLAMSVFMAKGLMNAKKKERDIAPVALLVASGLIVLLGNVASNPEAFLVAFLIGGVLAVIHPVVHADVFRHTSKTVLGSVMSLLSAGFLLFASLGSAFLPKVTETLGLTRTFEALGALSLVSGLFFLAQPFSRFLSKEPNTLLGERKPSYSPRIRNVLQD